MNDLRILQHDLRYGVHSILPKYASALDEKIEHYLAGDLLATYIETADSGSMEEAEVQGSTAIININGIIAKRVGLPQEVLEFLGIVDLDFVDMQLQAAMEDESITSVILYVTSPGGFISGLETTTNLVAELAAKKEVVVFSDMVNASAAYFISSAANSIVGTIDAEFGCIGTRVTLFSFAKALEDQGIQAVSIASGKYKNIYDETQPITDEAKAYITEEVMKEAAIFKSYVLKTRSIADEDMTGKVYKGQEALDKGFVDGIAANIQDVINILNEKE